MSDEHQHDAPPTKHDIQGAVLLASLIEKVLGCPFALVYKHDDQCPVDLIANVADQDTLVEMLERAVVRAQGPAINVVPFDPRNN